MIDSHYRLRAVIPDEFIEELHKQIALLQSELKGVVQWH